MGTISKLQKGKCLICRKEFQYYPSTNCNGNYCSRDCFGVSRRRKTTWNKGRRLPDDVCEKISIAKMGNVPWNKGKICPYSAETIINMSKSAKARLPNNIQPCSDDTKKKISIKCKGRIPINKGVPATKLFREKISSIVKEKMKAPEVKEKMKDFFRNHLVGVGKRCWYFNISQGWVCFRSSYELTYAKYLDRIKEPWLYESETFDLVDTTYTPDFWLIRDGKFIEVKGWMRPKSQVKIDKFKRLYPKLRLELVDEKHINELRREENAKI